MINSKQVILSNFIYHIKSWGGESSDWYVGITSDIEKKLFIVHKMTYKTSWIWDECENSERANEIKDYFISLGFDGDSRSGNNKSKFVYLYKKSTNNI